jgi:hypothetical protein
MFVRPARAHYCACGVVASVWTDSVACYDMVVRHRHLFSSDIDCNCFPRLKIATNRPARECNESFIDFGPCACF